MSSSFMLKMHSPSWMNSIDSTSARCFGNKAPASACICLATKFLPVAIDLSFGFVIFSLDLHCSFLLLSLVQFIVDISQQYQQSYKSQRHDYTTTPIDYKILIIVYLCESLLVNLHYSFYYL